MSTPLLSANACALCPRAGKSSGSDSKPGFLRDVRTRTATPPLYHVIFCIHWSWCELKSPRTALQRPFCYRNSPPPQQSPFSQTSRRRSAKPWITLSVANVIYFQEYYSDTIETEVKMPTRNESFVSLIG
ncbi:hypothetical protein PV325_014037 [Microctonus aethiopoides]|nr:hypothetical protein PV325_014037 [Microctonus aethiopoides]